MNLQLKSSNAKLENLILLRAIAVFIVCLCHFAKPLSEGFSYSPIFKTINEFGKYGVEIFFVISGFVIPLSLEKGKYQLADYLTFLYKRLVRLHPAYLAAILLTLIITYISFKQQHQTFPETINSVLHSIFFFHNLGFNVVFWTLYIEAQYYLFIGVFFILLKKYNKLSLLVIIPCLLILGQMPIANYISLLKHLHIFLIGATGYLIYVEYGNKTLNYSLLICLIVFSFFFSGIPGVIDSVPAAIASLFALLVILFYEGAVPRPLKFLGLISYSLYLTHFPVGTKFVRLFMKIIHPSYAWMLFFLAFLVVIPVAWLFNKYIEEPSENISKRIKYRLNKSNI